MSARTPNNVCIKCFGDLADLQIVLVRFVAATESGLPGGMIHLADVDGRILFYERIMKIREEARALLDRIK